MGENSWPTCRQLQDLMVEKNVKDITELSPGGIVELCRRLGSDPERGLPDPVPDFDRRVEVYGRNWVAEKKVKSYLHFAWEALQEKIVLLLLFIGTVELVVEMIFKPEERHEAWIEPVAIYVTVCIIVNVQAFMDWKRECLFDNLSKQVAASNLRYVIRGGKQINLKDEEVVVGDILTFNSHLAAMMPADGLMLAGEGVKMDESALTGEPEPIVKDPVTKPFMVSGTTVNAGQGKMLVICVGDHSVSGKIRKAVYDANGEESEPSPLFVKLDTMATQLGRVGTAVAVIVFITACIQGFAIHHEGGEKVIDYALLAFGILAVAVPEGLPLALTIALAISSNKMSAENNLVKTLDSCETMGSVTTICTDKTGTLTANRMTVQAASLGGVLFKAIDNSPLGPRVRSDDRLSSSVKDLTSNLVAVCTMDESQVLPPEKGSSEPTFLGNPTECAMLQFINTAGYNYEEIRKQTVGRSTSTRDKGAARAFSSARKMMSWAVPRDGGGYRVYAKGASEIILDRVTAATGPKGEVRDLSDADKEKITTEVIAPFAKQAFRTIGLAYKDVDSMPDDTLHAAVLNSDGSSAFLCETGLTLLGVFGIADPLRLEVPGAIRQCYEAGIDVRMVTGDNLVTAIAIARKAGILDESLHFGPDGEIKPKRAMEGKTFRKAVYTTDDAGEPIFQQDKFDEIWPYLRVLARSSPEDKLTLAKGLAASRLFADARKVRQLKLAENINIFPDSQVIAMTGDGTNDAPALKAADVGFAMGIAGTQISKDAANIILMDDNFASIVLAAKWGRNVFDSIQKFLQFQLTVNFAIVVISLLVSFSGIEAPLKLLHLLWLNMIMDSLAALAIANEPPTEEQLKRPPVNRSASIFTEQMWYNMIGQALYQIFLVLVLLFSPSFLPDLPGPDSSDPYTGAGSRHYTMIFNMFVLFQLFNEYNCRFLLGEFNIFRGLQNNLIFVGISLTTFALQVIMTQFAGPVMKIHPKGLTGKQWGVCIGLGAGPLVWQPVLNLSRMGLNKIAFWLQSVRRGHARAASGSHGMAVGRSSLSSASIGMDKE